MSPSLEQDIGQRQFTSAHQKALINLMYTNNHVVDQMNQVFKQFDISRQQYNVLRILRGQSPDPLSINVIKERMIDRMSDASRIVERLRAKALVERKTNEDDRRAVEIFITEKGLDLLTRMDESVRGFEQMFGLLNEEDAIRFNDFLDRIRQITIV